MKYPVLVKPSKSVNSVTEAVDGLVVTLRANPERGKANAALICVLADHFGVSRDDVRITGGLTGRRKIVQITKNPA